MGRAPFLRFQGKKSTARTSAQPSIAADEVQNEDRDEVHDPELAVQWEAELCLHIA